MGAFAALAVGFLWLAWTSASPVQSTDAEQQFVSTIEEAAIQTTDIAGPRLDMPVDIPAEGGAVVSIPISFTAGAVGVSSLIFSLDYDEEWLTFDPADEDGDGVPNAITFNVPGAFGGSVTVDPVDTDGELDVVIADLSTPLSAVSSGVILTLSMTASNVTDATTAIIRFGADPRPSFGSTAGQSITGTVSNGSVLITKPCYSLTLRPSPAHGGVIHAAPAPNCGAGKYTAGTVVVLTAQANSGFHFQNWSGSVSSSSNSVDVSVNAAKSATANFTACYSLTTLVTPPGSGTVQASPAPNCGNQYLAGTVLQLTAQPATGYSFANWSGGASGPVDSVNVTMNAAKTVMANFASRPPVCYALMTSVAPPGSGTVQASPAPNCGAQYTAGTVVQLTAQPATGYSFVNWTGGAGGTISPVNVTMNAAKNVTANFGAAWPVDPVKGGSVTVSVGSLIVSLHFPPGAVSQPATVTVAALADAPSVEAYHLIGAVLSISLTGQDGSSIAGFMEPVGITVRVLGSGLPNGGGEVRLREWRISDGAGGQEWVALPSEVDTETHSIGSSLEHTGTYAVLQDPTASVFLPFLSAQ